LKPHLALGVLLPWLAAHPAAADCDGSGSRWLAIIIDDLGYSAAASRGAVALPAPVTLSIIPGTPHAEETAQQGAALGKEIMVHLPMSSADTPVADPIALTEHLTADGFDRVLAEALASVPGARGVNNHMGSHLTTDPVAMQRLMQTLRAEGLFFIDSRTSADTVAAAEAERAGIPHASRNVFLDHDPEADRVAHEFDRAVSLARTQGTAIAIGHPHRDTLAVLRQRLVALPEDILVVPASSIVDCQRRQSLTSIPRSAR
jgi:polysaccharide deacetylase 2 family uncharacterized protein YibQ